MRTARPWWHWAVAAAACALLGWFPFVHHHRVPLLGNADLGFHELGHLVMYVVPISQFLTAIMGSVFQVAVPAGLAAYFAIARRDAMAATVCGAWSAANLHDVSVYIADAPYERLPLIGGQHDWAYLLGPEQLDHLAAAHDVAAVVNGIGAVLALATITTCVTVAAWRATEPRRAPTTPRAGDLLPRQFSS
jgi:hypothetical protein